MHRSIISLVRAIEINGKMMRYVQFSNFLKSPGKRIVVLYIPSFVFSQCFKTPLKPTVD